MDTPPPLRVLSVDGDGAWVDPLVSELARSSTAVAVTAVETLADARSRLQADPEAFDCVVTAAALPDGDGVSLVGATDSSTAVPVVVFADDVSPATTTALVDAGVDGFVWTGADDAAADLAARVERLAAERHLARRTTATSGDGEADRTWALERALDALDDVFYVFDTSGRLVLWNDRLNGLFGLTDEELAGMPATGFFLDADLPAVERAVEEVFAEGKTVVEARGETVDGVVLFQLTGLRLDGPDGDVVGFCGVGRDITRQRRHEERLREQNERLDEFARVLSHDLRNPLSISMGFLDLEREANDSAYLAKVATSLERMRDIVDDVLKAARTGPTAVEPALVSLDDVARAAWDTVETGDATLRVETDARMEADAGRLQRLFENLFRNAVEHAGPDPTVVVDLLPGGDGFAVEDDGRGIDSESRGRVFAPGYTTSAAGTGFGLDIVRSLADAHGWRVRLRTGATGGARFEFAGVRVADVEAPPRAGTDGGEDGAGEE